MNDHIPDRIHQPSRVILHHYDTLRIITQRTRQFNNDQHSLASITSQQTVEFVPVTDNINENDDFSCGK